MSMRFILRAHRAIIWTAAAKEASDIHRTYAFALILLLMALSSGAYADSRTIPYLDTTELGGAAAYQNANDHAQSPYYAQIDWFKARSTDTLTVLEALRTYQQTTETTCGPASALIVYDYLGGNTSALDDVALAGLCGDETALYSTTLSMLCEIFDALGWRHVAGRSLEPVSVTPEPLYRYIDAGFPVIVGWMEWGGHWSVVIGYDTMGTASYDDDVLVMAEPYDTFDHCQDGYTTVAADLFMAQWRLTSDEDDVASVYAPYIVAYPELMVGQLPDVEIAGATD